MIAFIQNSLPYLVIASQIVLAVLILALIFYRSWGKEISHWLGRHALVLGLLVSLAAVCGSLFYSNVVGFAPCELCWWQRIFIYPQVVLFIAALRYKDRGVFKYVWRLSALGSIVALYQVYVQAGGSSLIPCTAAGLACAKIFVDAFGYVTIPVMSLTVCVGLLILCVAHKLYEDRHA